jgi:hypothetical protein
MAYRPKATASPEKLTFFRYNSQEVDVLEAGQ